MNFTLDDIMDLREVIKTTVQRQIETAIDEVVANSDRHIGKRDKVCQQCFRSKPLPTKKCGNCSSSEFQDYICLMEVRLSLFLEWLKTQGYWPLSQLNEQSCREFRGSVSAIISNCTPCSPRALSGAAALCHSVALLYLSPGWGVLRIYGETGEWPGIDLPRKFHHRPAGSHAQRSPGHGSVDDVERPRPGSTARDQRRPQQCQRLRRPPARAVSPRALQEI